MPNTWSLSTTVRNPERIGPFLKALEEFEGNVFNEEVQANFFKNLIKNKLYQPTGIPECYKVQYDDPEQFSNEAVEEILRNVHYKNKQYNDDQFQIYAFRGRTAVGNLNKMGVAIAREAIGNVQLTQLGKEFLNGQCTFSDIMFRYFLKWQLPNPAESGYNGFNINPFIATLHVINEVNKKEIEVGNKAKGISKEEFALFVITLIDYKDISNVVEKILTYRKDCFNADDKISFTNETFINETSGLYNIELNNEKEINKKVNNLYDYADSAIRYFRQTGLIYYRGAGRYIDLSPTRIVEIEALLNNFDGSAKKFNDLDEYLNYLADINEPRLPWENRTTLIEVHNNLRTNVFDIINRINLTYPGQALHNFNLCQVDIYDNDDVRVIKDKIETLREWFKLLTLDLAVLDERSLANLDKYIDELKSLANRKKAKDGNGPLNLEWYTALTLMALDDAEEIKPNLILGDDNLPVFTAPGKGPDIESKYSNFNLVTEVTLLKARDQWYAEGQPVMRHLRDFEESNIEKETYCLFLAPTIHRDTLNTFWMSIKMGYEGRIQKIIPLTIIQYTKILEYTLRLKDIGKRINSNDILELLKQLFEYNNIVGLEVSKWIEGFDFIIDEWYKKLK